MSSALRKRDVVTVRHTKKKKKPMIKKTKSDEAVKVLLDSLKVFDAKSATVIKDTLNKIMEACDKNDEYLQLRMVTALATQVADQVREAMAHPGEQKRRDYYVSGRDGRAGTCPIFFSEDYGQIKVDEVKRMLEGWKKRVTAFLESKDHDYEHVHFNCHKTGAGGFAPVILTCDATFCADAWKLVEETADAIRALYNAHVKKANVQFNMHVYWQDDDEPYETVARVVQAEAFSKEDSRVEMTLGILDMLGPLARGSSSASTPPS